VLFRESESSVRKALWFVFSLQRARRKFIRFGLPEWWLHA